VNKFNAYVLRHFYALMTKTHMLSSSIYSEAELLDDLNDHWTAGGHKRERNWLIDVRLRQLFLSSLTRH
jgi:hypothetical protein